MKFILLILNIVLSSLSFTETKPTSYIKQSVDVVHCAGTNVSSSNSPACSVVNNLHEKTTRTSVSSNQKNLSIDSKLSCSSNNSIDNNNDTRGQQNSNQEENLLFLFDNTHNHNNKISHSESSSPQRLSNGWAKLMHSYAGNQASVIQSCSSSGMVTSRVSPISPPMPMKYNLNGLDLPSVSHESQSGGLMGHTTVISHIGADSPVHYSNLDALTSSNNNDTSYINQNNPYHWSSSASYTNELSPLNLQHKPSTVIEKHDHQHQHQHNHQQQPAHQQQQHHDYYVTELGNHISNDSSVGMKSFLTLGSTGYSLEDAIGESDHCSGVSISSVPTDQHLGLHTDEAQNYLTLTTASILQNNNKGDESPYHSNNNTSTHNNLHHHSTSSESRSPSVYETFDNNLSLTTLNTVNSRTNMYASSPVHGSTDHPSVIHGIYDNIQSR